MTVHVERLTAPGTEPRRMRPAWSPLALRDTRGRSATHIDVCQHRHMPKSQVAARPRPRLQPSPVDTVACSSPLTHEPLSSEAAERIASLLKALADPVRLRVMSMIASHADGESCVCDLTDAFDLSQPKI